MPDLMEILNLLDEQTIARRVSLSHEFARERYQLRRFMVENFREFQREITDYTKYHFAATTAPVEMPDELAFGMAWQMVDRSYGSQGGIETAYRNAKTGTRGGLSGVLTAIANALREEREEAYVNYILRTRVDPLDFDQVVDLMSQYLARFGRYIPAGTTVRAPAELAANWPELIKLHSRVVSSIRGRLGRV